MVVASRAEPARHLSRSGVPHPPHGIGIEDEKAVLLGQRVEAAAGGVANLARGPATAVKDKDERPLTGKAGKPVGHVEPEAAIHPVVAQRAGRESGLGRSGQAGNRQKHKKYADHRKLPPRPRSLTRGSHGVPSRYQPGSRAPRSRARSARKRRMTCARSSASLRPVAVRKVSGSFRSFTAKWSSAQA